MLKLPNYGLQDTMVFDGASKASTEPYFQNAPQIFQDGHEVLYELLIEQYKIAASSASQAIDRIYNVHRNFIVFLTVFAISLGVFIKFGQNDANSVFISLILSCIFGLLVCVIWHNWIRFLSLQSQCRQEVLENFETWLPASPFRAVNARLSAPEYFFSARIERSIPFWVGLVFLIALIVSSFTYANYALKF